jgi:hypothetical protein
MMEVTKETIEEAQAYGKKKVAELKEKEFFGKIDSHLYATQEKGFSRNYCVQKFFKTVDINILANNIKVEHFV